MLFSPAILILERKEETTIFLSKLQRKEKTYVVETKKWTL